MTVGELIYQQAIKDGYDPATAERLIYHLKPFFEAQRKAAEAFGVFREPLEKSIKMANSALESIRPQIGILNGVSFPTIDKEDFVVPRTVQEVRIVNPEALEIRLRRKESSIVVASYLLPKNTT